MLKCTKIILCKYVISTGFMASCLKNEQYSVWPDLVPSVWSAVGPVPEDVVPPWALSQSKSSPVRSLEKEQALDSKSQEPGWGQAPETIVTSSIAMSPL